VTLATVVIDGDRLTIDDVNRAARLGHPVEWPAAARGKAARARALIDRCVSEGQVVYGVTTGFGKLSSVRISTAQLEELQANLIRSHAAGTGRPLADPETRAALLIRANVLAKGHSGVRPLVIEALLEMLNRGVLPVIPEKGSVGASGDLAPSAHIALVLMGEGEAAFEGRVMPGADAMRRAGIPPLTFQAKEGLAVLNGTHVMAALGCLLVDELDHLAAVADMVAALSTDAMWGTDRHFDPKIHQVRPHPGQAASAAAMRRWMDGSEIRQSHVQCDRVQDAYSMRCTPQVHGAVRDTLDHARRVLEREINSATDNPLVFPDEGEVISGGNFHGEPLAFIYDFLGIAAAELGGISERRTERMVNPDLSGLPAFLAREPGLNSGFMIAQLTAVALLGENKILAHPASVDSLPTSGNKEDHVSMGMTAALKLRQIVENIRTVLGIELLVACQALDFHRPARTSPRLEAVHAAVRRRVPFMDRDRHLGADIAAVSDLLRERGLPLAEG
jgi:histidine ammonia-lyase